MAKQRVGNTALGAAVCRLIEQFQPEQTRLFHDPVVKDLVGAPIRVLMQFASVRNYTIKQTDAIMPGIYGAQICRTRFIDEAVEKALSQGIGQVVILGAGLDTRSDLPGAEKLMDVVAKRGPPLAVRPGTFEYCLIPLAISSQLGSRCWECRVTGKLSQASRTEPGGVRM